MGHAESVCGRLFQALIGPATANDAFSVRLWVTPRNDVMSLCSRSEAAVGDTELGKVGRCYSFLSTLNTKLHNLYCIRLSMGSQCSCLVSANEVVH